jgi:rSAM/selenodomain-associated transferase 1
LEHLAGERLNVSLEIRRRPTICAPNIYFDVSRQQLIIFVKAPRPGHVKTRIAEAIGPKAACDAYIEMVSVLVGNLRSSSNVQVRYTPDEAHAEISRWIQPAWTSVSQGQGDLGQRLVRAFQEAFNSGIERVLIIGSDSPDITADHIQSAFSALKTHDLVLGPAEDGGYWLIGLRAEQPALFDNIPWSSGAVLEQTLARSKSAGLSTYLLCQLPDIDTADDLRRFQARCAQQSQ